MAFGNRFFGGGDLTPPSALRLLDCKRSLGIIIHCNFDIATKYFIAIFIITSLYVQYYPKDFLMVFFSLFSLMI